jgi:hypothetical protein
MRGGCKPIRQSDGPVLDRPVFIFGTPSFDFEAKLPLGCAERVTFATRQK